MKIYIQLIKPVFDFIIAFLLVILLSPLIFSITICLLIVNKGNPFFFQLRPGLNGKIFKLIKFRTMTDRIDALGNQLPDKDRITNIGKVIRSLSLDELPQMINVIKGEMSLIGPRPLLVKYLLLYNDHQKRRHEVKPGITGWVQVNGRNNLSWAEKFELDVWYVDHLSIFLDMKIFLFTITRVLQRKGINASENKTMSFFNGNN